MLMGSELALTLASLLMALIFIRRTVVAGVRGLSSSNASFGRKIFVG
jgi:hypothetical protein